MRVSIIAKSGAFRSSFARLLRQRGIRAEIAAWPANQLAAEVAMPSGEPTLVLLETETWDERTEAAAAGLFGEQVTVQVVSAAAKDPAIQARILAWGASRVIPDDEQVLARCLVAVQWWLEQREPSRVRLGEVVFDPVRGELIGKMARIKLTGKES